MYLFVFLWFIHSPYCLMTMSSSNDALISRPRRFSRPQRRREDSTRNSRPPSFNYSAVGGHKRWTAERSTIPKVPLCTRVTSSHSSSGNNLNEGRGGRGELFSFVLLIGPIFPFFGLFFFLPRADCSARCLVSCLLPFTVVCFIVSLAAAVF